MAELRSVTAFGSIKTRMGSGEYARLDTIISLGLKLLISDAPGADEQIQQHLARRGYRNVVVYHNGRGRDGGPRRNLGAWPTIRVHGSFEVKDQRMCGDADAGLAFWNGYSDGTDRNMKQLEAEGKRVRRVVIAA